MRPPRIDFVAHSGARKRLGAAVLVLALVLAGGGALRYVALNQALDTWEGKYRALKRAENPHSSTGAVGRRQEREKLSDELKQANRVIARLSFPWETLFRELDTSTDENVTLLGVTPDQEQGSLRLNAEARQFSAMLEFLRRLEELEDFDEPTIVSHQVNVEDPQHPVRFEVQTGWRPIDTGAHPGQR